MTTPGDPTGPARTCVVTVHDGPDGVRWAEVSVQPRTPGRPDLLQRTRHIGVADVLADIEVFLVAAGLR